MSEIDPVSIQLLGFELLDDQNRASIVPPDMSVDGDPIQIDIDTSGQLSYEFLDLVHDPRFVLEPLSFLSGASLVGDPEKISRALGRYLDPKSILHAEMSREMRDRARVVASIPHFRREMSELFAWLAEREVTKYEERYHQQELVSDGTITDRLPQLLGSLSLTALEKIIIDPKRVADGGLDFFDTLVAFLRKNPSYIQTATKKTYKNPKTIRKRFEQINPQRRAQILKDIFLNDVSSEERDELTQKVIEEAYTDLFGVWFEEPQSPDGVDIKVNHWMRTKKKSPLAGARKLHPNARISVDQSTQHSKRRTPRLDHRFDVRFEYEHYRRDLRAVVTNTMSRLRTSEHEFSSRLVGYLYLSLLFRQEMVDMSELDREILESIEHSDPVERSARRCAFGLILLTYNSLLLALELEARVQKMFDQDKQ